jgi:hypothetical protein
MRITTICSISARSRSNFSNSFRPKKPPAVMSMRKYAYWYQKDSIKLYRQHLMEEGVLDDNDWQEMVAEVKKEIEAAAQK